MEVLVSTRGPGNRTDHLDRGWMQPEYKDVGSDLSLIHISEPTRPKR